MPIKTKQLVKTVNVLVEECSEFEPAAHSGEVSQFCIHEKLEHELCVQDPLIKTKLSPP